MAVDFAVDILTSAGEQKIAQATAGNRLVYTRVLSSAAAYEAAAASSLAPGDLAGPAGAVKSASATDGRARVVGAISSENGPAALKTFALCGRLESEAEDAVLVVKSDPDIAVPLPGPESPSTAIEIDFVMEISAAASVTVQITGPGSVTMADLDRFVSIHKAGDTEAGDSQSILGKKAFINGITAGGIAISEDGASVEGFGLSVSQIAGDYSLIARIRKAGGIADAFSIANGPGNTLITTFEGNLGVNGGLACGALSASGEVKCLGRNLYLSNGAQSSNGYTLLRSGTATTPGFSVSVKRPSDNDETPLVSASYYNSVASVTVPNFTSGGYASIKGWMEVYQSALFKDSVHVIGNLQVDGTLVNASLWGSGAGALVVAHVTVTTGAQISDYINISRGQQIFNGQGWTGEGGASITLGVTADGYTVGTATRLRTLAPISVSTPAGGGTGSAVEVLAIVEIA